MHLPGIRRTGALVHDPAACACHACAGRMTDVASHRRDLRAELTGRRRQLDAGARLHAAQGVRRNLERLPEYLVDERIAGYWACAGELPLNLAMAPLAARGQQFHLPVVGPERRLRFAPWAAGDAIEPNRYGIPEPRAREHALPPELIDLVLVPLVAFDRHGNRLGLGGGYYDASFAFLHDGERPTTPLLVGVGYAFQEVAALVHEPWDVRMDYIATDNELIDCTG